MKTKIMDLEKLKFPIGKYSKATDWGASNKASWINDIETLPSKLKTVTSGLTDQQLDTPYRPEGWTVAQLVHHVADSHMNAYMRAKLALTEDVPTIKPYDQDAWVKTPDVSTDIKAPMSIVEGIHQKWSSLYKGLNEQELSKVFYHPEAKQEQSIIYWLSVYSWHSNHHLAHITELAKRSNW